MNPNVTGDQICQLYPQTEYFERSQICMNVNLHISSVILWICKVFFRKMYPTAFLNEILQKNHLVALGLCKLPLQPDGSLSLAATVLGVELCVCISSTKSWMQPDMDPGRLRGSSEDAVQLEQCLSGRIRRTFCRILIELDIYQIHLFFQVKEIKIPSSSLISDSVLLIIILG